MAPNSCKETETPHEDDNRLLGVSLRCYAALQLDVRHQRQAQTHFVHPNVILVLAQSLLKLRTDDDMTVVRE
jgi:hypothetical protein